MMNTNGLKVIVNDPTDKKEKYNMPIVPKKDIFSSSVDSTDPIDTDNLLKCLKKIYVSDYTNDQHDFIVSSLSLEILRQITRSTNAEGIHSYIDWNANIDGIKSAINTIISSEESEIQRAHAEVFKNNIRCFLDTSGVYYTDLSNIYKFIDNILCTFASPVKKFIN